MEDYTPLEAKEHLEDLMRRAAGGEDVRISHPTIGTVRLQSVAAEVDEPKPRRLRVGHLAGTMQVPARLMEPMSEEELRDWYGDD